MKNIDILMLDGCTRSEAQKHLDRGTTIYDEADFREHLDEYTSTYGADEEEIAEIKKKYTEMLKTKKPLTDWGVIQAYGKVFFVEYCL